jgi:hypothetical protein
MAPKYLANATQHLVGGAILGVNVRFVMLPAIAKNHFDSNIIKSR